jgi:hypothetical protein
MEFLMKANKTQLHFKKIEENKYRFESYSSKYIKEKGLKKIFTENTVDLDKLSSLTEIFKYLKVDFVGAKTYITILHKGKKNLKKRLKKIMALSSERDYSEIEIDEIKKTEIKSMDFEMFFRNIRKFSGICSGRYSQFFNTNPAIILDEGFIVLDIGYNTIDTFNHTYSMRHTNTVILDSYLFKNNISWNQVHRKGLKDDKIELLNKIRKRKAFNRSFFDKSDKNRFNIANLKKL